MKLLIIFFIIAATCFLGAKCDYQYNQSYNSKQNDPKVNVNSSDHGKNIEKPYLGIKCRKNSSEHLEVIEVVPESPAEFSNLQPGDQILTINNVKIENEKCFLNCVNNLQIDKVIFIEILRNKDKCTLPLRVGSCY